jgi:hypothetical protein
VEIEDGREETKMRLQMKRDDLVRTLAYVDRLHAKRVGIGIVSEFTLYSYRGYA